MITTSQPLTLEQLARIKLVQPDDAGGLWQGIKHIDLINAVLHEMQIRGCKGRYLGAVVSNDKADLAAVFKTDILGDCELGVLTSNARRHALKLFVGSTVKGALALVSAEINVGRKREGRFNLENRLASSFDEFEKQCAVHSVLKTALDQYEMSSTRMEKILCEAGRRKIVPWSRLSAVDKAFTERSHHGQRSALALLLAFSSVIQRSPPLTQMSQQLAATQLVEEMSIEKAA